MKKLILNKPKVKEFTAPPVELVPVHAWLRMELVWYALTVVQPRAVANSYINN
jgi:hypothetical protein